jgi:hypothetical protein
MAQGIILKCDKCGKTFEFVVGHLKSTDGIIPDDEIEKKDGKKAKDFVSEIFNHRCDGKVFLESKVFAD